jgi:Ca2+-binding RTX toxin-like protein
MTTYKTLDYLPDLSSSQMALATLVTFLPVSKAISWNYVDAPTYGDLALILSQVDRNPSEWDNVAQYATTSKILNSLVSFQGIKGATYDFANICGSSQAFQVYDNLGNVIAMAGSGISSSSFIVTKDYHYAGYYLSNFLAPYTGKYYIDANWVQDTRPFVGLIIYENRDTAPKFNQLPSGTVTISGEVQQDKILTASNNLADEDGLGVISYQWLSNGIAITNANQNTYTLTQGNISKLISVRASYTDLLGTIESVTSAQTNPIAAKANLLPAGTVTVTGNAIQNQILTASNNLMDVDGLGAISYTWLSNGNEIANANQGTYKLTQADVGKVISVRANYTDLLGTAESINSAATINVTNVNDTPTGTVTVTGNAIQNQILTASNNLEDADGLGTISYTWFRNGTAIINANQGTYKLTQADVGKVISVRANYTDLLGTAESVTSFPTNPVLSVNYPPTGSITITGSPVKGALLTVSNNLADANGLGAISYKWLSNGVVIPNANQSSYQLTQADTGQNISVKASYIDLQNTAESVISDNLAINKNNVPIGSVTIKGLATWGTTLSVTNTIKDVDGIGKLSYSWQSDNGELLTSPNYTLEESDVGTKVWVTLSYTDKNGSIEQVDSKPVDVIISTKPSPFNDILAGTDKVDKLSGLAGNDTLIGGAGSDKLTGGKGKDTFVFSGSDFYTESSNGDLVFNKSVDTITDFNLKEHDVIDFGDLGELSFYSSLGAAQDDMASLFYVKGTGKIYLNTNETDGFTPSIIIVISGKSAVNGDMTDFNYPT